MSMKSKIAKMLLVTMLVAICACMAQQMSKRLYLKSGDYQLATEWEQKGDRLRYFSSERKEWEEIPNSLVDWTSTEKWNAENIGKVKVPEDAKKSGDEKDEDLEAPDPVEVEGVLLPESGGIFTLEHEVRANGSASTPHIVELAQNGGDINPQRGKNILRAMINPIPGGQSASVELQGAHSAVKVKSVQPVFYILLDALKEKPSEDSMAMKDEKAKSPQEILLGKFRLVKLASKGNVRTIAALKISLRGSVSQQQVFLESQSQTMPGGWIKFWPQKPLEPGEYAIVEMLSPTEMNLYVWDFEVGK